ncbi:hypothetical protein PS645_03807 [Pseudomonas fluorescens]|uniref:Uncharacterized protein n=1 Tax=Pseudomonas fluorescens TaxID=294 RepID=A0A5E6V219_PSEFL|nr:hypothetical protein PS645_03807 [Pseudomonas fluorescens]
MNLSHCPVIVDSQTVFSPFIVSQDFLNLSPC